jgi:hypothetical protein
MFIRVEVYRTVQLVATRIYLSSTFIRPTVLLPQHNDNNTAAAAIFGRGLGVETLRLS